MRKINELNSVAPPQKPCRRAGVLQHITFNNGIIATRRSRSSAYHVRCVVANARCHSTILDVANANWRCTGTAGAIRDVKLASWYPPANSRRHSRHVTTTADAGNAVIPSCAHLAARISLACRHRAFPMFGQAAPDERSLRGRRAVPTALGKMSVHIERSLSAQRRRWCRDRLEVFSSANTTRLLPLPIVADAVSHDRDHVSWDAGIRGFVPRGAGHHPWPRH